MDSVAEARSIAERLLSHKLPQRWTHVQAVAEKAERASAVLDVKDRSTLVAAAWLHDVGYAPDLVSTGLHALDGAQWLRREKFDDRVVALVAYHSCATFEAQERNLAEELGANFSEEESSVRDLLWYVDMTTGPDGQDMNVRDRLDEVRKRYGPGHVVTRFWARAEPTLLAAVKRAEALLARKA
ncbi:HD domain-containing protein [Micromonospora sp. 15K316]|uniref:HD domain-containing protein n=1 Tax=Micromonospora sp. 15K316 TaxID=2530376 RepID=UPI001043358E|nr:HD domain-containing protein [Micromonospora sp. 15K316]TDC28807.1 HD domain-containing protein [Micromonospora sp. 15K316]